MGRWKDIHTPVCLGGEVVGKMSYRYSTALSHIVLAGTSVYCLKKYGYSDIYQFPVGAFGLIFTNSVIGVLKWGTLFHEYLLLIISNSNSQYTSFPRLSRLWFFFQFHVILLSDQFIHLDEIDPPKSNLNSRSSRNRRRRQQTVQIHTRPSIDIHPPVHNNPSMVKLRLSERIRLGAFFGRNRLIAAIHCRHLQAGYFRPHNSREHRIPNSHLIDNGKLLGSQRSFVVLHKPLPLGQRAGPGEYS